MQLQLVGLYAGVMTANDILTKGSICAGTGALDRATPGELIWVAEKDEDAAALLERKIPGAKNLGDITAEGFDPEPVDLLTSGDPCQSLSAAGRQMASVDDRFLWPFVVEAIRRMRPRHVFLENVQNLISVPLLRGADDWTGQKGSVLKMRLDDLRAAGYAVKWMVLGACAVGAPHHRHRWFLRARYVGAGAPEAERVLAVGRPDGCGAPRTGGRLLLPTPRARDHKGHGGTAPRPIDGGPDLPTAIQLLPTPTRSDGTGGPGKSANGHDGYNLRTAVQLLPTSRATDVGTPGRRSSNGWRPQLGQVIQLLPTPEAYDATRGGPQDPEKRRAGGHSVSLQDAAWAAGPEWGAYADAVTLWASIIGRPAPEPTIPGARGGRRLNPALSEWMMGYPEGYLTEGQSVGAALRQAGNGVLELQATAAWDLLEV